MSNSQGDVRTALVEFLTAATKILALVTPAIEQETAEKYRDMSNKRFGKVQSNTYRKPTLLAGEDDEVPF